MKIHRKKEQGFSYIDVMIAIVILMVGVLAMLSALTANLIRSYESEKRIVAKQLALSSLESIISAKEISRTDVLASFDAIRNVGSPTINGVDGIFMNGFNPIRDDEGLDGVAGTADDACALGGPCVVGTYTNNSSVKDGYEREIIITDIDDPER
ncbi:MAG: type IV pilus modification PilV family protein, partial [Candidatus Binatia bacterium]